MRLSPAQALEVFAAAYGLGLDLARAADALAAVTAPVSTNEIKRRRVENRARPVIAAFERETGGTFDQAVAPSVGIANPALDDLCARLRRVRLTHRDIVAIVGRDHRFVARAIARHEARAVVAKALPAVGLVVAVEQRMASHE